MSADRTDRAWAFHLPVDTAGNNGTGFYSRSNRGLSLNNHGGIAMVSDARAVRQAILLLLATRPGERVMRPDYGCWLHRLVFAPNDAGTAGLAIHYVRDALERWEPRAVIDQLTAGCNVNGAGKPWVLDIVLDYHLRRSGEQDQLSLGYDLHEARLISAGTDAVRDQPHSRASDNIDNNSDNTNKRSF